MMTKPFLWMQTLLLVCAPLVMADAAGAQVKAPAPMPTTVQIDEIGSAARVALNIGDTLRILLKGNPSTGYSWAVAANNDALLKAGETKNLPAGNGKMGAPGRASFTFTAQAVGHNRLQLEYKRPWEKNTPPARSLTLDVVIRDARLRGDPAFSVKPSGTILAQYVGKLPCADCSGIHETLSLYTPGPNQYVDAYYVKATTYMGASGGNTTNVTAGTWFLEKGMPSNANATVYALSMDSTDQMENYQFTNGELVPLDGDRTVIHSPFNMALHKTP